MAKFDDLLKVLDKKVPSEPVLFEFYLNIPLLEAYGGGKKAVTAYDHTWNYELMLPAQTSLGYSYITMVGSNFHFPTKSINQKSTISLNDGAVISDRKSLSEYDFMNPDKEDYSALGRAEKLLDKDKKIIVWSNGGILENVITLVGYENLCMMMYDDYELVKEIFDNVGSRFYNYYENCLKYDGVGAVICNDDWGFDTQTMISPEDLRKLVFPYYKKIVELCHKKDRRVILHSCGNLESVYEDIISDMKFDAKHSYEDKIMPVEQAYEKLSGKIAVLGGIDVDFLCRKSEEEINLRACNLLEMGKHGGYALGSGNSIPEYIPTKNFLAMINAVKKVKY